MKIKKRCRKREEVKDMTKKLKDTKEINLEDRRNLVEGFYMTRNLLDSFGSLSYLLFVSSPLAAVFSNNSSALAYALTLTSGAIGTCYLYNKNYCKSEYAKDLPKFTLVRQELIKRGRTNLNVDKYNLEELIRRFQ